MEPLSHKGSGGVRISTHLYNTNEDVVRLLEALQEIPGPAGWLLRAH